jgi:hypothetical protein
VTNFTLLCHGRPRLLRQTLDSLGDLDGMTIDIYGDAPLFEVRQIVHEFMRGKEGSLSLSPVSKGTGTARNRVIQYASYHRGDYLYLSDDDVFFLRPDWLSILIRSYEAAWEAGFKVIGGYNHPYHLPIATIPAAGGNVVNEVYTLALQSMLMKWEVWDKYGPFCQTPPGKVCQSEDVDFTTKIRADGGRIGVIAPPLIVNCGITNSIGDKIPGWELVQAQAPEGVVVE